MTTDGAMAPVAPREVSSTLFGSDNPEVSMERAVKTAKVLAKVIEDRKMYTVIGQGKHVRVEGWQTLGALVGVFPIVAWTRKIENGWEARVEARRADGSLVGAAESECLNTERNWSEAKGKEDHHLRSMAQTRATSKALAQPLRFIIALAGYEGTPAEEMPRTSDATNRVFERAPVRDPQEKAPAAGAAPMAEGTLEWRGMVDIVTVAEYPKKKDGKPTGEKGKRYTITAKDGAQFTTFSETHAQDAKSSMPSSDNPTGFEMAVRYSVSEYRGVKQLKAEEVYPLNTGTEPE